MRNLLTACLPALALFALGGCAGTSALTSSEDDGVYYSSQDRTTVIARSAPTQAPASPIDEAANPDYNGNQTSSSARQGNGSDQYYDNTYTYMRGAPSYSPPLSYYTPYSPYTSLGYGGGYGGGGYGYGGGGYGYGGGGYGGFGDPFYSSFNSPFGYGYGSGIGISFGFGRPFGYGGFGGYGYNSPFGYGYGSPFGYGYGGGFYDPFYYGSSFYGGYYGRGGYYGNSYYGNSYRYGNGNGNYNNGSYSNGSNSGDGGNGRTSGHRDDRASDGRYSSGGAGVVNPSTNTSGPIGGRVRTNEQVAPTGTGMQPMPAANGEKTGRIRTETANGAPSVMPARTDGSFNQPQNIDRSEQPRYRQMDQLSNANGSQQLDPSRGKVTRDENRGGLRNDDLAPQGGQIQPQTAAPQDMQRRRGGFFQNVFSQPANNGQAADQSRRRSYEQPQQQQRAYEQPRQQRTYEQPQQQQRTYEQPQQRSYSQPSYGGGDGNSGGGGGGGGGRGRSRGN